jgi:hypothetical protein
MLTKYFLRAEPILFFFSYLFGYSLYKTEGIWDSVPTLLYIILLAFIFINEYVKIINSEVYHKDLLKKYTYWGVALQLGLLFGLGISPEAQHQVWQVDTYSIHLPRSLNVSNFLHQEKSVSFMTSVTNKTYFTHIWVGLFYYLFGVNSFVTLLSFLPIKIISLRLMFKATKNIFDSKAASLSTLLYLFSPMTLFYTNVFYKYFMIQLYVISIIYLHSKLKIKFNLKDLLLLCLALLLCWNDRFYLAVFMLGGLTLDVLLLKNISFRTKVIFSIISLIIAPILLYGFKDNFNFKNIYNSMLNYHHMFVNYKDVDPINRDLFYPLKIIKFLFTPFFTTNKFEIFYDLSYLLIWGSFQHQLVTLLSLYGLFESLKKNLSKHIFHFAFSASLILIFAYVAPYSGRIRDCILPIIIIYSSYTLVMKSDLILKFLPKVLLSRFTFSLLILLISLPTSSKTLTLLPHRSVYNSKTESGIKATFWDKKIFISSVPNYDEGVFTAWGNQKEWEGWNYLNKEGLRTKSAANVSQYKGNVYISLRDEVTSKIHIFLTSNGKDYSKVNLAKEIFSKGPISSMIKNRFLFLSYYPGKNKLTVVKINLDNSELTGVGSIKTDSNYESPMCFFNEKLYLFLTDTKNRINYINIEDPKSSIKSTSANSALAPSVACSKNEVFIISTRKKPTIGYSFALLSSQNLTYWDEHIVPIYKTTMHSPEILLSPEDNRVWITYVGEEKAMLISSFIPVLNGVIPEFLKKLFN